MGRLHVERRPEIRWGEAPFYPQLLNMGGFSFSGMSVVEIDKRGRVTIPKEMRLDADKALLIPLGDSYMLVPIAKAPIEFEMSVSSKDAKRVAERRLASEVKARLRRRQK